jgi:hypothetical protein
MSTHYTVIHTAVKKLDKNTPEARKNLYSKAREAMLSHLRNGSVADIDGKLQELDAAIAKVEDEQEIILVEVQLVSNDVALGISNFANSENKTEPNTFTQPLE